MDLALRVELLSNEMELLQGIFNKYDQMIVTSRNWLITMWMAAIGIALTTSSPILFYVAPILCVLYWAQEGLIRYKYWFKYVQRYRLIRSRFNNEDGHGVESLPVYDLTDNYGVCKQVRVVRKFRICFFRIEPTLFYLVLAILSIAGAILVNMGALQLDTATTMSSVTVVREN